MPLIRQLQWEELDLLQGLEAIPTEDDNGGTHYRVRHDGLVLLVSLWPDLGLVDVTLVQTATEAILLDLTVAVRGRIRYNNDKRGEYLEFADCVLVSRVTLAEEQLDAAFSPNLQGRTMLLASKPHVSVLFE
ncbi:hypothetical protein LJ737_10565 [Hymenobacter sp. 15J16-1T3B]|uniref:hypothetical protein n=1 Tax=Hymenobacter sp. 15J16-1T3B TaxID=2886941 RepID=UPI001D11B31C|nr:hypothetical protein [Hymenobacter sp. 15J16-1T3B]MCC3157684.1 hypothetical protein [Hymenobacter sp. 15J16-1T3B]